MPRTPSAQPPTLRSHRHRLPDPIVKIDVPPSFFLLNSCKSIDHIRNMPEEKQLQRFLSITICNNSIALFSLPLSPQVGSAISLLLPPMRFHARILRPARQTANEPERFLGTPRRGRGILRNWAILSARIWRGKSPDSLVQQLNGS